MERCLHCHRGTRTVLILKMEPMAESGTGTTLLRMLVSPYGTDELRDQVIPRASAQLCKSIQMWIWTRSSTKWTSVRDSTSLEPPDLFITLPPHKLNPSYIQKIHLLGVFCLLAPLKFSSFPLLSCTRNVSYCQENVWANNSFWRLWVAPEVNWCAEFYMHTPPQAGSAFASNQPQWAHAHPSWGLCTSLYPATNWEAKPWGWKRSWKQRSEWFGRNWSYCKIFQDEPTGGLESSSWLNGLKKENRA